VTRSTGGSPLETDPRASSGIERLAHRRLRTARCRHSERISANSRISTARNALRSIYIRERSRVGSRGSSNFREQSAIRPSCPSVSRCRAESMHGLSYPKSRSRFLSYRAARLRAIARSTRSPRDRRVDLSGRVSRRASAWRNFPRKIMHSRAHGARGTRWLSIRSSIRFPERVARTIAETIARMLPRAFPSS